MSTALANSALPSARNSILPSAPVAFSHCFMTKTSLTPVTATASTPFFLKASTLLRKLGRCRLLQVGVKAPGTANSATLRPLKTSSVVLGFGPSAVITRKVALGTLSQTLMGMGAPHWVRHAVSAGYLRRRPLLVEAGRDLVSAVAFHHGESQVERAFAVHAGRQAVEREAELPMARRRALHRLGDRQRPFRAWSLDENRDGDIGWRRQIERHQRLDAAI